MYPIHACTPHTCRTSKKMKVFCFRDLDSITVGDFLLKTVIIIQLLICQPEEAKDTESPASKVQAVRFR